MSGATATRPDDRTAGPAPAEPTGRARAPRWLIAGAVSLIALLLPPGATAALLVGRDSLFLADVTAGVWIFKGALLLNVAAVMLLAQWLRAPASGAALLDWRAAQPTGQPVAALAILLTLALALRLPELGAGLWHDEIATLLEYGRRPVGEILATYPSQNQHPLYSLLARASVAVFGLSAWALRLPAVLLGTASLAALYAFGTRIGRPREALLATLLLAVSYHHVWFSQNARGYTGLMLLSVLGSGLFLGLLNGQVKRRGAVIPGYGACMALAIWTHLTAAFVVAAHFVIWSGLALRRREPSDAGWMLAPLFAMVLAATFALQLYALMLPQFGETLFAPKAEFGATPWRSPVWLIAETLRGAARGLPGGWAGLAAGAAVAVAGTLSFARRSAPLAALLLLPAALTAAALVALNHNLWPRFFFFAAGFAVLIAVRGVFAVLERVWPAHGALAAAAMLALAAAGSAWTLRAAWGPKQDYEAALARATQVRAPGDVLVAAGLAGYALRDYLRADVRTVESEAELVAAENTGPKTWMLYSFPTHLAAAEPEVWARIQREYHSVAEFPGTLAGGTVYLLSRP